jgi:hypothetical protein
VLLTSRASPLLLLLVNVHGSSAVCMLLASRTSPLLPPLRVPSPEDGCKVWP